MSDAVNRHRGVLEALASSGADLELVEDARRLLDEAETQGE